MLADILFAQPFLVQTGCLTAHHILEYRFERQDMSSKNCRLMITHMSEMAQAKTQIANLFDYHHVDDCTSVLSFHTLQGAILKQPIVLIATRQRHVVDAEVWQISSQASSFYAPRDAMLAALSMNTFALGMGFLMQLCTLINLRIEPLPSSVRTTITAMDNEYCLNFQGFWYGIHATDTQAIVRIPSPSIASHSSANDASVVSATPSMPRKNMAAVVERSLSPES